NHDATEKLAGEAIFETLADVPLKVAVRTEAGDLQVIMTVDDVAESSIWLIILRQYLLTVLEKEQNMTSNQI
ncbi:hypothetical protein Q604_UNBC09045G0001, partial [human gut metagenome]